jgi:hypothetical protein
MAGEHHLTIQLLRDIDSRTERGIVVHLATSTDRDTAAQLAAVSNAIVAALVRRGSSSRRSELANCEQQSSMPGVGSAPAEIGNR